MAGPDKVELTCKCGARYRVVNRPGARLRCKHCGAGLKVPKPAPPTPEPEPDAPEEARPPARRRYTPRKRSPVPAILGVLIVAGLAVGGSALVHHYATRNDPEQPDREGERAQLEEEIRRSLGPGETNPAKDFTQPQSVRDAWQAWKAACAAGDTLTMGFLTTGRDQLPQPEPGAPPAARAGTEAGSKLFFDLSYRPHVDRSGQRMKEARLMEVLEAGDLALMVLDVGGTRYGLEARQKEDGWRILFFPAAGHDLMGSRLPYEVAPLVAPQQIEDARSLWQAVRAAHAMADGRRMVQLFSQRMVNDFIEKAGLDRPEMQQQLVADYTERFGRAPQPFDTPSDRMAAGFDLMSPVLRMQFLKARFVEVVEIGGETVIVAEFSGGERRLRVSEEGGELVVSEIR